MLLYPWTCLHTAMAGPILVVPRQKEIHREMIQISKKLTCTKEKMLEGFGQFEMISEGGLSGGFNDFLFSPLFREDSHFD